MFSNYAVIKAAARQQAGVRGPRMWKVYAQGGPMWPPLWTCTTRKPTWSALPTGTINTVNLTKR